MQRRTYIAAGAATLAAWFAAAEIASFAHEAAVRHATCAEHGESIHVGAGATTPAPARQRVTPGSTAAADHDHCSVTPMAAGDTPDCAPTLSSSAAPQPSIDVIPPAAPPPAIALLLVAPKSSPPV